MTITPSELASLHQRVAEELTEDSLVRLVLFAQRLARFRRWRGFVGGDVLPGGESAQSVVSRVVEKTLSGQNRWQPNKVPLHSFLKMNIRREIGHLARGRENLTLEGREAGEQVKDVSADPERRLIALEFIEGFFSLLKNDPTLRETCERLACGEKPRIVAKRMGLSREEIYNQKKRLRRLLSKYLSSQDSEKHKEDCHA